MDGCHMPRHISVWALHFNECRAFGAERTPFPDFLFHCWCWSHLQNVPSRAYPSTSQSRTTAECSVMHTSRMFPVMHILECSNHAHPQQAPNHVHTGGESIANVEEWWSLSVLTQQDHSIQDLPYLCRPATHHGMYKGTHFWGLSLEF